MKASFFLLIILNSMNSANAQQHYIVKSKADLNKIEQEKNSILLRDYKIPYNKAYVFEYNDGTSIIHPSGINEKDGILFDNYDEMNQMIDSRKYPVEGDNSFWMKESDRLLSLKDSIAYFLNFLSNEIDVEVTLNENADYLMKLSKIIGQKKDEKRLTEIGEGCLGIFICELVRRKCNGDWKYLNRCTLNVSYEVEIVSRNKYCSPFYWMNKAFESNYEQFDIEKIIQKCLNSFAPYSSTRYVIDIK